MGKFNRNDNINKVVIGIMACFLFISTASYAGGPWPKKKGEVYFKISEWWMTYDKHFTDSGVKDPNTTTGIFSTYAYAEYGISNRLTGIVNGALFTRNYMNNVISLTTGDVISEGEAINAIGDFELGIKFGLTKDSDLPVSLTVMLGIPSGQSSGGTLGNLQTGDGEFNQIIQMDIGKSFSMVNNNPAYVSIYTGFNNRTQEYSEEFRYGIEFGLSWLDSKLWTTARLNGIESLKNGSTAATTTSTGIFSNNSELVSLGFELNYYFKEHLGISIGLTSPLRGELLPANSAFSLGFFLDLSQN